MRVRLLLVAAFVVTGCSMTACPSAETQSVKLAPVTEVKVTVTCDATTDSVRVKVDPWTAPVKRNKDLEWELTSASNADTMTITPKVPGDWLYQSQPPYGAKKGGAKAKGSNMKGGLAKDSTFSYNIQLTCQNGTGPKHLLVIDPEVIIVD